jgi:NitT/TauT family transport system ATP-binding protein
MPFADAKSPAGAGPVVSLCGVGKSFQHGVTALDCLDLDIRDGEFVTLLGPSGCGKSTALRIVAGLTEPTCGALIWSGGRVPQRGDIGFVFQEPTLMPWQTVAGNVALPLALAHQSDSEAAARVDTVLRQVGLSDFAARYPRELSGGMKMRVSIARALATSPRLLLMDEPFAALDEITRFRLNNDLLTLWHDMRTTCVFVTHSVFESVYLSSRVIVMTARPGRVFAEIAIEAPYPRGNFRTSAEYAAYCREVSDALEQAMRARKAP